MSRESEFAGARMRHSIWNEYFDDVMCIPVHSRKLKIKRKAFALIRADRAEMKMDRFLKSCDEILKGPENAPAI